MDQVADPGHLLVSDLELMLGIGILPNGWNHRD